MSLLDIILDIIKNINNNELDNIQELHVKTNQCVKDNMKLQNINNEEEESIEDIMDDPPLHIDEYKFDVDALKNPTDNHCLKCKKKFTSCFNLAICRACMRSLTINKTAAMKIYNLKQVDLEDLDCYPFKNCYGSYTVLYFLKEIRLIAIIQRFSIYNPTLQVYADCIETILEEANDKEKIKKERGLKLIEARKKNQEIKIENERISYDQRKEILKKALKDKGITLDTTCDACNNYLEGVNRNLKSVVKQAKIYSERKNKLETELAKKNLKIRNDSYYCQEYLKGNQFTLQQVVDMMESMDFFMKKTAYVNLLNTYRQKQYDDAKEYGYWDGERIELDEDDKNKVKKEALKKYLTKNDKKSVPACVLNRYS